VIPAENTTGRPRSRAFPPWIRVRVSAGEGRDETAGILRGLGLHTVCEGARCPNLGECWHNRSAAFMILGDHCTRNCRFCAVGHHAGPPPPDPDEPAKVAEAAKRMASNTRWSQA
jgi:lipoic acid synthetase